MRTFTPEQVEQIRLAARRETGLGPEPALLYMEEVARRAGCHPHTIRVRRGNELPAGRWVSHPHAGWGFTEAEAKQIADWWKRHRKGRQGRRPGR